MSMFKKPSPREAMREGKRDMAQATRGIEREVANLQAEEKKLVAEIKQTAKAGNQAAVKALARELVRLRAQIGKLQQSRAHIRGMAAHAQAAQGSIAVAAGMRSAAGVMANVNKQLAPAAAARMAADFQREAAKMEHAEEVVGDTLDGVLDSSDTEEEVDELTSQILDDIGIDTAAQLSTVPPGRLRQSAATQVGQGSSRQQEAEGDGDMQRRFAGLTTR